MLGRLWENEGEVSSMYGGVGVLMNYAGCEWENPSFAGMTWGGYGAVIWSLGMGLRGLGRKS